MCDDNLLRENPGLEQQVDKEPSLNSQTDEQTNIKSVHTAEACSTEDIPQRENHTVIIDIPAGKESNNDHLNGRLEQGP